MLRHFDDPRAAPSMSREQFTKVPRTIAEKTTENGRAAPSM